MINGKSLPIIDIYILIVVKFEIHAGICNQN